MNKVFSVELTKGRCPVHHFGPVEDEAVPVVLQFMDGFGPRPTQFGIAERLVKEGYRVLLPDLFYSYLPYEPLKPSSLFSGGEDRQRMMEMLSGLSYEQVAGDVNGLLEVILTKWGKVPVAAVGYCMGGRYALCAATLSEQVVASASLHGSNLAASTGGSPHLHFERVKASVYVGVAEMDPTFDGEEEGRLVAALRGAGVNHTIETYQGAAHGFVMNDLPVYNLQAAEKHWSRLSAQLKEAFGDWQSS